MASMRIRSQRSKLSMNLLPKVVGTRVERVPTGFKEIKART
jgi:hypothetical protein